MESETSRQPLIHRVVVRDLSESDIPHLSQYWFHSPAGYLEAMGVDPKKLPPQEKFESGLREKCNAPSSKLNALIILFDGRPVGFHTINPLTEGDHGIFHAHIWDTQVRRKGIASVSYPKACQIFMRRFGLKRILFKTPAQNTGSIRVKEKLGIRYLGEETVDFGIVKDGTLAKVFELNREEADFLVTRMASPLLA
jgi:RimJ/RimL family protein N-acetyltransferase